MPLRGELLIKPLSAATVRPTCTTWTIRTRPVLWDPDRDTIMGHEFVGEVVGHGPDCSDDFPIGTRVTSMPILIRAGKSRA